MGSDSTGSCRKQEHIRVQEGPALGAVGPLWSMSVSLEGGKGHVGYSAGAAQCLVG